jgi:hypothetical protein
VIKRETPATENYYTSILWNSNPLFTNIAENDFTFQLGSSLNNTANAALTALLPPPFYDIKGVLRNAATPDIGAYEN